MAKRPVHRRDAPPDEPSTTRRRRSSFVHGLSSILKAPRGAGCGFARADLVIACATVAVLLSLGYRTDSEPSLGAAEPAPMQGAHEPPTEPVYAQCSPVPLGTRVAQHALNRAEVPAAARPPAISEAPVGAGDVGAPESPTAAARLSLTLLDGQGLVVSGSVHFEIRFAEGPESVRTLTVLRSAPEPYELELPAGSMSLTVWGGSAVAGPLSLVLAEGERHHARLVLQDSQAVSGRIVDATTSRPVAGARVSFWTFAESDVVSTDASGAFTHPRFPAGLDLHQVRVEAEGYGSLVRYVSADADGRWALYSNLAGAPDVAGLDGRPWIELALQRAVDLTGVVLGADGSAIANAHVLAEGYVRALDGVASRDAAEGRTDPNGRFRLSGLRADVTHGIRVHAGGFAVATFEAAVGASDLGRIVLRAGRAISGTLFDPDGMPAEGELVALVHLERPAIAAASESDARMRLDCARRTTRTDSNGLFLFEDCANTAAELLVHRGDRVVARELLTHGEATSIVLQVPPVLDLGRVEEVSLDLREDP